MKIIFIAVIAGIALSGCATKAEREAAYWDGLRNQCAAIGFPNSPGNQAAGQALARCVSTLHEQQRQRQQDHNNSIAAALAGFGNGVRAATPPPAPPAPPQIIYPQNRPVNCTSNKIGETVYTNCR